MSVHVEDQDFFCVFLQERGNCREHGGWGQNGRSFARRGRVFTRQTVAPHGCVLANSPRPFWRVLSCFVTLATASCRDMTATCRPRGRPLHARTITPSAGCASSVRRWAVVRPYRRSWPDFNKIFSTAIEDVGARRRIGRCPIWSSCTAAPLGLRDGWAGLPGSYDPGY